MWSVEREQLMNVMLNRKSDEWRRIKSKDGSNLFNESSIELWLLITSSLLLYAEYKLKIFSMNFVDFRDFKRSSIQSRHESNTETRQINGPKNLRL